MPLPTDIIAAKNSLSASGAWLYLLEILVDGEDPLRLVQNSEDVTWDGNTWTRFPFQIDEIGEDGKGEVPRIRILVSNVGRSMQALLEEYDGISDATVNLYVVHSDNLDETDPVVEYAFEVQKVTAAEDWVTFELGAENRFNVRCPRTRLLKNFCRWDFKSTECGYSGGETACDHTLSRCRELSNSERFGGFPGMGSGGVYA
jgi:lambda family phage minor tail protein L